MKSLRSLFRIGLGPSSSHTMGPNRAAKQFAERCPNPDSYRVTLYGSLAATGEGHMTDVAIIKELEPIAKLELIWEPETFLPFHPNGMLFEGIKDGKVIDSWKIYSVGGGELANEETTKNEEDIYPLTTMHEIMDWCDETGCTFWEYVEKYEGPEIWDYLGEVWATMQSTIKRGLENEGVLPGGLGIQRKALTYLNKSMSYNAAVSSKAKLYAYALATSEENASGSTIVTTPTCGSSGVLPAVLYHLSTAHNCSDARILRALATAGLFGNVAKEHASISGADVGCQGEIGVACARVRLALPVPWRLPLPASSLAEQSTRLSMLQRWDSNTTWDSLVTRFAALYRCPVSSATQLLRHAHSMHAHTRHSPTASTRLTSTTFCR